MTRGRKKHMRPATIAELIAEARFPSLEHIVSKAFGEMVPPVRMSVPEAAQKYMRMGSGSGHGVPWSATKTPYMIEPMEMLTSLDHQGVVFVGPARTGKSVPALGWIAHTVITDPEDMMFVQMDRENARKWSKGDLDRFLAASPEVRKRQMTRREDDNTFDKQFSSGMRVLVTYPTANNLSNITVGKVWLIDYERMDDLVDGEGTPWDMAQKRTQTKGRFGMTVAEASPNPHKEIRDPKWSPSTPHEAPPIRGIFEIYNRGDRRRWHWCCPSCGEWFEPDFKLLDWGGKTDPMEAKEATVMVCPSNGCVIKPTQKFKLNLRGRWVPEGGRLTPEGNLEPRPGMVIRRSDIASFWLKGPAAAYQSWGEMVLKYLNAQKALEETGDDGPLRTTVTTDQGSYYIPASRLSDRSPEDLKERAEDWGSTEDEPTVPHGVRFIVMTVDVQKTAFVLQAVGFMANGDAVVIDGFKVRLSNRLNADGDKLPIDPFAYGEDWDTLIDAALLRSYPLADGSGRRMRVRAVGCDSGGGEGAAANAYNFWRRLKKRGDNSHRNFILVKGEPSRTAPRARTTWPDSSQKDRNAIARGDVPVLLLNANSLKDQVSAMLARRVGQDNEDAVTGGMLRYPDWMPQWFYAQMTTEIRTDKGWENPRKRRNEVFDLTYYAIGVAVRPVEKAVPFANIQVERIDWNNPPAWAADWDDNDLVFGSEQQASASSAPRTRKDFAELAKSLA
ncbi:terminase gpA endonuclease subunit [Plastorhodobacter daqingensis]|uniref:Terminase gpA endonuclease subunit n=1 Tax=Plastorhodobacter daqingensis TaxID=1387281 RepID=A0ABW2UGJ7_9RHOB